MLNRTGQSRRWRPPCRLFLQLLWCSSRNCPCVPRTDTCKPHGQVIEVASSDSGTGRAFCSTCTAAVAAAAATAEAARHSHFMHWAAAVAAAPPQHALCLQQQQRRLSTVQATCCVAAAAHCSQRAEHMRLRAAAQECECSATATLAFGLHVSRPRAGCAAAAEVSLVHETSANSSCSIVASHGYQHGAVAR